MSSSKAVLLSDIKNLFKYYEALGFENLPVTIKNYSAEINQNVPKQNLLDDLITQIGDCTRCKLSKQRKNIVFGFGNPDARLMFIGEGPGEEEDIQGIPFVGKAGILLTKLIERMGFKRENVYIANIVKCRPPMNRDPEEDEVAVCRQFIEMQIEIIRPEVIMTLGRIAAQVLLNDPKLKITAARGHFHKYNDIPVMPTFHPAYLLRNPSDKWKTWADAQKVLSRLGIAVDEPAISVMPKTGG